MGKLYVIGIGPGGLDHITLKAAKAIEESDIVVGYTKYLEMIKPLIENKEVYSTGMRGEEKRCEEALRLSADKTVALVSTGDSGIYGMAGLILEMRKDENVEIIPGITASSAAGAVVGAPLMHDNCNISLSDLMTPYEEIKKRVSLAAEGDFVISLYNPKSKGRPGYLKECINLIKEHRGNNTPIAVVRNALRDDQSYALCTLENFNDEIVDMFSIVIIGNSKSYIKNGIFITPRGYKLNRERSLMIGFILGTSEGKKFLSLINEYTEDIIVSTATEYGGELLSDYKVKHINTKPLDKDGLNKLIKDFNIKVLVDASHPYAEIVSKNAMESCKESNIEYIRYERLGALSKENSENIIRVKSYEELETVINNIPGNILNTTGSKNIGKILSLNIENRVIHRILPSWQILKEVLELGVEVSDVVAIKGPIGYELNKGFIYQDNIKAIITKDSGVQGGVLEKLKATTDTNIKLIVIEKTKIEYGQVFNKEEEIVNYLKIKYKELLKK